MVFFFLFILFYNIIKHTNTHLLFIYIGKRARAQIFYNLCSVYRRNVFTTIRFVRANCRLVVGCKVENMHKDVATINGYSRVAYPKRMR